MTSDLETVCDYIDRLLNVAQIADWDRALNGLQVENSGSVQRLAAAVDACQYTIDRAAESAAQLLIVHHGLFWDGLVPLTGRYGRRLRTLIEADIALYSSHLPLDLHPDLGNNVLLGRLLGLTEQEPFGDTRGQPAGLVGHTNASLDQLARTLAEQLGAAPRVIPTGPPDPRRVGVVSGAGGNALGQARAAGVDTYVTGEASHHVYFDAEEWGINLVLAGHYATETLGVKALASRVADEFDLPWDFIDHRTGL